MKKRYWIIQGYDGLELIYERKIPIHCIGGNQMVNILKCLAAKAGLDFDEIVGAFARRRTRISNGLLDVKWNQCRCGENPYFVARVIEE